MMRLLEIFIILRFLLSAIYASSALLERRENGINGYDCGDVFFMDEMVRDVPKLSVVYKKNPLRVPYVGPLYSDKLDYMVWPILPDGSLPGTKTFPVWLMWRKSTYQVVFEKDGKVIDVIVRIANGDFAKCWRIKNSSAMEQLYNVEESNGYQCAHHFISDETIEIALSKFHTPTSEIYLYPQPYTGSLYDDNHGLLLWPIFRAGIIYQYSALTGGPYFIVVNTSGHLKDVIARTAHKDFIRCMRLKGPSEPAALQASSSNLSKHPKIGYLCNKVFFDDKNLLDARKIAEKSQIIREWKVYPLPYDGPPFNSPSLLWPVSTSGNIFRKGKLEPFRLVLSLDFDIKGVIMENSGMIKVCDRIGDPNSRQNHNKDDYQCQDTIFTKDELFSVAQFACKAIPKRNSYPARYRGPKFEIEGPYLTYPILKNQRFVYYPGPHRLVMNEACKVVGAITYDKVSEKMVKCVAIGTEKPSSLLDEDEEVSIVEIRYSNLHKVKDKKISKSKITKSNPH